MYADSATDVVWQRLRATRAVPPVAATKSESRQRTYRFSLEQAEQMFAAAARVGPATQPVLAFYGLSQAGRAVAAAADAISTEGGWRLKGHGIRSSHLERPLPDLEIRTDGATSSGSFTRLSALLDSPIPEKAAVSFHQLWDLLPGNEMAPLRNTGSSRRTPLWIEHRDLTDDPHPLASVATVGLPPWVLDAPNGRAALDEYLEAFPHARDYHSYVRVAAEPDSAPAFHRHVDGRGEVYMHWAMPSGAAGTRSERLALLQRLTRPYNGRLYFFPALPGVDGALHPLMAWWAVLHTLSMLARYQPAEWCAQIDVDASPHAVRIERLLKEAIRVVPCLIAETIEQVAKTRTVPPNAADPV